jgi:predicted lipid-binding transport protein (Tim44 family)
MTRSLLAAVLMLLALSLAVTSPAADAKRLGAGKSSGMQRSLPPPRTPESPPAKPAQPPQAAPSPTPNPTAAPAAARRSWLGPIAGLAAGLGIAALMSHFGMGEAFGNILTLALLALLVFVAVRFVLNRMRGPQMTPAMAGGGDAPAPAVQVARPVEPVLLSPAPTPPTGSDVNVFGQRLPAPGGTAAAQTLALPPDFDREGFERIARTIFIRMQAANDSANLDELRQFTTPEMFAACKLDLMDRGAKRQQTEVLHVDAEVLDLTREATRHIVSVRFHGAVREKPDAAPEDFDEVWHLVKPADDSASWAIAGIQQRH